MSRITNAKQLGSFVIVAALGIAVGMALAPQRSAAQAEHAGHAGTAHTKSWAPVEKMHLYLCAFHIAKENPKFQIEAHHFCSPAGKEIHQCVVFDSNDVNARLLGVEYIITDEAYRRLPEAEKKFWHPHAYEILSGQLVAPDMPKEGDDMFPGLIRTWGKTWHTWRDPSTEFPVGEPLLMWSANGDGQIDNALIGKRDAKFGVSTDRIRERRKAYGFAVPSIPPPRSMSEPGRQWTPSGPDEPTKTMK